MRNGETIQAEDKFACTKCERLKSGNKCEDQMSGRRRSIVVGLHVAKRVTMKKGKERVCLFFVKFL